MTSLIYAWQGITWIKVERPKFDLVGVVLSSLGLAGLCAVLALGLGVVLGVVLILRSRRTTASGAIADGSLQLLLSGPPGERPA
jgi:hypothetical protein